MNIPLTKGTGRILVMDDEDFIRDLLGEILKQLGYESVLTRSGEEAVEKFKAASAEGKPFHAVILDLTVPGGMNGTDTLKAIRALDPAAKIIAASGHVGDAVSSDLQQKGFTAVLSKPCRITEISQTLHRVITGNAPTQ